jgi:hypothetical protein
MMRLNYRRSREGLESKVMLRSGYHLLLCEEPAKGLRKLAPGSGTVFIPKTRMKNPVNTTQASKRIFAMASIFYAYYLS